MKASWRHLGFVFIATQAVGCFGVRYRDSMSLPTCDPTCQTEATASAGAAGHQGHEPDHQLIGYDQPMIPPRPKFHPVPTRPAFAPRVQYSPPQLIQTPAFVKVPNEASPIPLEPTPALMPIPEGAVPLETCPPIVTAPPAEPISKQPPQPLPQPSVPAKPIIAPLPRPLRFDGALDQPESIQPIRGVWRTKPSS